MDGEHTHKVVTNGPYGHMSRCAIRFQLDVTQPKERSIVSN